MRRSANVPVGSMPVERKLFDTFYYILMIASLDKHLPTGVKEDDGDALIEGSITAVGYESLRLIASQLAMEGDRPTRTGMNKREVRKP
jgi:hypothetical protein